MESNTLKYRTRDGDGNDIVKDVEIKKFDTNDIDFICPICKRKVKLGVKIKDIVSADFTDWSYVGEYVCVDCADLFSLHFFSYVVDPDGIHLINVREVRDRLVTPQKTPFLFAITTSKKKHLFYRSKWNYGNSSFFVNLETETIHTTPDRMRNLQVSQGHPGQVPPHHQRPDDGGHYPGRRKRPYRKRRRHQPDA